MCLLKIEVPAASDNDTTNILWRLWTSEILDEIQTQRQRDKFRLLVCCLRGKLIHHLLGQRYFRTHRRHKKVKQAWGKDKLRTAQKTGRQPRQKDRGENVVFTNMFR